MSFIYPQSNCYVVYSYGKTKKAEASLKLLEPSYPVFIDVEKHYNDLPFVLSELNDLTHSKRNNIFEYEFPIIFKGLELIGNYENLIEHLKKEIQ